MPNFKVSIIEKVKLANGKWTNLTVKIPKSKPNGKGLYLKDSRDGNFYLLWHEGGQRRYHSVRGSLNDAITSEEQKELYLASVAKGLHVEDPVTGRTRLTIAGGIDEYLSVLTGRGNTVSLHTFALRQFQEWNTKHARNQKVYLDAIDRQHILAFRKWAMEQGDPRNGKPNDEVTAVWKCMRVNKMIKTMLGLAPGQGPVKKSDFAEVLNRKPTVVTYTKDERDRFLACCEGDSFLIWSLFLKCGLRYKELSHLEWTDIDWCTHVIRLRVKFVKDGDKQVEFRPKKHSIPDVAIADDLFLLLEQLTCSRPRLGVSRQGFGMPARGSRRGLGWTRRSLVTQTNQRARRKGARGNPYRITIPGFLTKFSSHPPICEGIFPKMSLLEMSGRIRRPCDLAKHP